jgi:hypothetical protein
MSPNHPPTIDLDSVQDKIDDLSLRGRDIAALALKTANGNGNAARHRDGEAVSEGDSAPPVPRLGIEAADNMTRLAKAAAEDIRRLGRLALEAGKRVHEECDQMALDVEANGGTVALHLTGLSQLLADVGMSNRETLRRLLGDMSPSIVPPASGASAHAVKQTAGAAKAMDIPFAKKPRRAD